MQPKRLRLLVVLAALLLAAPPLLLPDTGVAGGVPFAEPDVLGPWDIGRATFTVIDPTRDDRSLVVDAWYPVDSDDAVGVPESVYDLVFATLPSDLSLDAPPVAAGSFPLIAFSHGNQGIRFQSFFLTEHLASHGFVVVAPDHSGNTAADLFLPSPPFTAADRPQDISFVISQMLEKSSDPADSFAGRIDPFRIGVAGHSFGGFTTVTVASGFLDLLPDLRVSAILPISPATTGITDAELARVGVPSFFLSGTLDSIVPVDPGTTRPFALIPGTPRYRADILDAGHNSFTDICAIADALAAGGLPPDLLALLAGNVDQGCAPELIDLAEAHRLSNLYAVAFFKRILEGDKRYQRFLDPKHQDSDVVFTAVKGKLKKLKKSKKSKQAKKSKAPKKAKKARKSKKAA